MPPQPPTISFSFDAVSHRRIATFAGELGDADFFEAYARELAKPDYDHSADDLVDLSFVTHLGVTTDGLRRLAEMFSSSDELGYKIRVAIVAPATAVCGVSRMYQMLRGDDAPEEIKVFRGLDEAHAWLDEGRMAREA